MVRMGRWSTWIARFSVNEVRIGVFYECDVDVQCVCSIMLVIDEANRMGRGTMMKANARHW